MLKIPIEFMKRTGTAGIPIRNFYKATNYRVDRLDTARTAKRMMNAGASTF